MTKHQAPIHKNLIYSTVVALIFVASCQTAPHQSGMRLPMRMDFLSWQWPGDGVYVSFVGPERALSVTTVTGGKRVTTTYGTRYFLQLGADGEDVSMIRINDYVLQCISQYSRGRDADSRVPVVTIGGSVYEVISVWRQVSQKDKRFVISTMGRPKSEDGKRSP